MEVKIEEQNVRFESLIAVHNNTTFSTEVDSHTYLTHSKNHQARGRRSRVKIGKGFDGH